MIDFWIYFWVLLLIAAMLLFGGLAVAVTIGGLFDVRALFRSIREQHEEEQGTGD